VINLYSNELITDDAIALAVAKEKIKREIINELWARQNYDMSRTSDYGPYGAETAEIPSQEPFYADRVIKNLLSESIPGLADSFATDQGKGILYGIGTAVLLGMFSPSLGHKVQNVITGTATECLDLVKKARSIIAKAKEDIEDIIAEANYK